MTVRQNISSPGPGESMVYALRSQTTPKTTGASSNNPCLMLIRSPTSINCLTGTMSSEERVYVNLREQDVLCGRGRLFFEHSGNIRFRDLIEEWLPNYSKAVTKSEKTCFVRKVVSEIASKGGRFLKLEKSNNRWYEGGPVCAKSKVGHAFRDLISESSCSDQASNASASASSKSGDETENDSDDTDVSEGVTSLLLLGKTSGETSGKTGNSSEESTQQEVSNATKQGERSKGVEPAAIAVGEKARLKDPETKPIVAQRQTSSPTIKLAGILRKSKHPSEVMSSKLQASRSRSSRSTSSLASVKKIMMQTLMMRQQALAKGKNFPTPLETKSSPDREHKIATNVRQDRDGSIKQEAAENCRSSLTDNHTITRPPSIYRNSAPSQQQPVTNVAAPPLAELTTARSILKVKTDAQKTVLHATLPPAIKPSKFPPSVSITQQEGDKKQSLTDRGQTKGLPAPVARMPVAAAAIGQTTTVHPLMLSSMLSMKRNVVPGMVDTQSLKRAMLRTLASRQRAIEQHTSKVNISLTSGKDHIKTLLQRAKAARPSASEILQQAMAVQTSSSFGGRGKYGPSRNDLLQQALVAQSAAINGHAGIRQRQVQKKPPPDDMRHPPASFATTIVSPETTFSTTEVIASLELKRSTVHGVIGLEPSSMKRRRSSSSSRTVETKKKSRSLAEVAHENTLQGQIGVGPYFSGSTDVDDESNLYFL